jgi:hypothetical protein
LVNEVKELIAVGIVLAMLLDDKSNTPNFPRLPIAEGIAPVKLFEFRFNRVKDAAEPT